MHSNKMFYINIRDLLNTSINFQDPQRFESVVTDVAPYPSCFTGKEAPASLLRRFVKFSVCTSVSVIPAVKPWLTPSRTTLGLEFLLRLPLQMLTVLSPRSTALSDNSPSPTSLPAKKDLEFILSSQVKLSLLTIKARFLLLMFPASLASISSSV